jgi:hypothetical protein
VARKSTCMTPGCKAKAQTRGVCTSCYMAARRAMKKGADEQALIDNGLLGPSARGGKSPWRKAAEKAGLV